MPVRKMHYNWKIFCVYFKEKPLQSRTEPLWSVFNLYTVLLDCSGFLHKENVPVRVLIVQNTMNYVNLIQSLGRFPRLHLPETRVVLQPLPGPCLDDGHLVLTA